MDDVAIFLEHVDLLDGLDGLHVHLLQRSLQLLVIGAGRLVDLLDLAAGSALASSCDISFFFCQLSSGQPDMGRNSGGGPDGIE